MKKCFITGLFFAAGIVICTVYLQFHHHLTILFQSFDDNYLGPGLSCSEALSNISDWSNDDFAVEGGIRKSSCEVPPTGFKSWKKGAVTILSPKVQKNCSKLLKGDKLSTNEVKSRLEHWKNSVSDKEVLEKTKDCSWVRDYFSNNLYTTKLERSFPMVFTYVVYNSPQQILRLLRLHYRQHNVYCIHTDKGSEKTFMRIFRNIAACLDNVIVPEELVRVTWGKASVLEASMSCLKELARFRERQPQSGKWKYVLNLCGKELPLTTTHGIVKHLTSLNGSSNIYSYKVHDAISLGRLKHKHIPCGLTYHKSMAYNALSYKFVNFVLTNPAAIALYEFFRDCLIPDEHYYATLFRIPGVPGGYNPILSHKYLDVDQYFWMYGKHKKCGGKEVHDICIISVSELKEILRISGDGKRNLFHNKYFMELDHVVMDCMEERLVVKNMKEFQIDCEL